MKTRAKIEFGDFQTPLALARDVCALLTRRGIRAETVIEPTCGVGSFLIAAAEAYPSARLLGWDINASYVEKAANELVKAGASQRASVGQQDFFDHDWEKELAGIRSGVLILGNLPWVTNAALSGMNGSNLPAKENFQGFRGIEARTGKSNFDISEWMLIRLIKALRGRAATIAMLCKTATARKFLRFAWQNDGRIACASLHRIDAKGHFNASVDACLLLAQTGETGAPEAQIFSDLSGSQPTATLGLAGQDLVADVHLYQHLRHLEGLCPYQWRSGVKHDCAAVMELQRRDDGRLCNKHGELVAIEDEYLYPLLKCSDLANGRLEPRRYVLITQRKVGEDTATIADRAPGTWSYLNSHREAFEARKSSIYNKSFPFALFGVGDYTFAPWKVAVSGLHRVPRFELVGPQEGRPVLFDDTCYFLSFDDQEEAALAARILNSSPCQQFLSSLIFTDSKRPVTVELLQRLNIHAIARECGLLDEWTAARNRRVHPPETPLALRAELVMDAPSKSR